MPYPFVIAVTENDGIYNRFNNKKFEEEIGYTLEEIKTIDDWFLKAYPNLNYRAEIKAKWMAKIDGAQRENRNYVMERTHITTKHNGKKWYEVKTSFTGNIQFVAFVNINDVIEKDEQLERINENKNKILSILGHDLKSPLQNLNQLIHMLTDGGLTPEEFKENLVVIQRLSSETLQFIDTTFTWTRSNFENHQPAIQEFLLAEIINSVLVIYRKDLETKKIIVNTDVPSWASIFCDREIIHIALRNLISNAVKFAPPESIVTILHHQKAGKDYITVSDLGEGIPAEVVTKILNNQSNKTSGAGFGMGLRLCKELLQQVNGEMEIKSEEGKGTSVSIVIPSTAN